MAKKSSKKQPKQPNATNVSDTVTAQIDTTIPITSITTDKPTSTSQVYAHIPATTRLSFFNFLTIATTESILAFLELAATTPEGANLERLWERAYEEGYEKGRKSLLLNLGIKMEEKFEEGVERGMDLGREEGYTVAKEAFDNIIKVVKAKEALKVDTTEAGSQTETRATTTSISVQTDSTSTLPTSYSTSSTQTSTLYTTSHPTMDVSIQTNPINSQTSCQIIKRPHSSSIPTSVIPSASTATMGIQTESITAQHHGIGSPTLVATSQHPELPINGKNAKNTKISTTQAITSKTSQNITISSLQTSPVASPTSLTSCFNQNEHLGCPNGENATDFSANTDTSPSSLPEFEVDTEFGDGLEISVLDTVSDPIASNETRLGHDTSSAATGFAQNQPKTRKSLILFKQKPETSKAPTSGPFNWADDAAELPTLSIQPTKQSRDFSSLRSSSKKNPFSSLQRRHRQPQKHYRFNKFQPQSCCHHAFQSSSFHFAAPLSPQYPPQLPIPTFLNWDHDPRLADLSRALRVLGWVRQ